MNEDIKRRWVEALRSGEYPQARDYLHSEDGFCCLGVLCKLAETDGIVDAVRLDSDDPGTMDRFWTFMNKNRGDLDIEDVDKSSTELPFVVARWAGLGFTTDPKLTRDGICHWASEWNDDQYIDFHQIADMIENNL